MTEPTTQNTIDNGQPTEGQPPFMTLVEGLAAAGVRFGITLGKIGLQQASKTLETTSVFLGEVAGKLEKAGEKIHKTDETPKA
jgi:hypothetical protein